ncbi:hypothetical protein CANINC_001094 [Pichia inconspicua]|uniref:Uncharacterized protein n=1 Tax=Pichia inconspicua TaxID=52247 RepID=A0A4T0X5M6_9ASCO|nr:hypothetical protein CANINC_001094 [[Candida] inconspicua]
MTVTVGDIDTGSLFVASSQTVRTLPPNFVPGWKYTGWTAPTNGATRDRHNDVILPRRKRIRVRNNNEQIEREGVRLDGEETDVSKKQVDLPIELRPNWVDQYRYLTPEETPTAAKVSTISYGDRYICKCGKGFELFLHYYKCRKQHE